MADPKKSNLSPVEIQKLVNAQIDEMISDIRAEMARVDNIEEENNSIIKSVKIQRFWFNVFRVPVLILLPPALLLMAILTLPFPKSKHRVYHHFLQYLHQFGLWVLGLRVQIKNLNTSPLPKQVIFVGNADPSAPLVMQAHLPGDFRMVVGYDLFLNFKQFFVDYLMKKSLYLPVDPDHLAHLYGDIRRMRHFLNKGHRLAFAVRRHADYQSPVFLLKYHPMPVVPVFVYLERPANKANWTHPTRVTVVIGKPITISNELLKNPGQRNTIFKYLVDQIDALQQHAR